MSAVLPWCWFDTTSSEIEIHPGDKKQEVEDRPGQGLFCHRCRHPITTRAMGIAFNGNHVHSRINPAGITYDFACYSQAPGCAVSGPPTPEHSWFAGYRWEIALCAACGEHLGWCFHGSDRFFGLVLGRLIEVGD